MLPYIHIILPSYAVLALVGGFMAVCWMFLHLDKYQLQFTEFLKMFVFCVIGGYVGSKVLFAITQIPWLIKNFSVKNLLLLLPQSGLVFYGGLFGVIFMLLWLTRKDMDLRKRVFRLAAPAMPLFHVFGRIGCFLTGCCHGKKLASPLQIGPIQINQIPVQLIEAFAELLLFIIIAIIEKKSKDADLLRIYLVTYAVIRFADEFLRGDTVRGIFFGLSTAQWVSLAIILVYLGKFVAQKSIVMQKTNQETS